MEEKLISAATKKNWNKLGITTIDAKKRLSKRANKRYSTKNIIPVECFSNAQNLALLSDILNQNPKYDVNSIIYNLSLNLLKAEKLITLEGGKPCSKNKYLVKILKEFEQPINKSLLEIPYPRAEQDFLGIVYQSLLKEGVKNLNGSYYTPDKISDKISNNINEGELFLDPCCGSGIFLLKAADKIKNPNNIYGCDIDDIACFIAKINLIVKFKDIEFYPNIYNINFLSDNSIFKDIKFDIIATNPPWGALTDKSVKKLFSEIKSGESFSYFIFAASAMLSQHGRCMFVLPKSILNIACHKDIRKFILENFHIEFIENLGRKFSGVLSETILIKLVKPLYKNIKTKIINNRTTYINQSYFKDNVNYNFSLISEDEAKILKKIFSTKHYTLNNSTFALGIVTGNNKKHIKNSPHENFEKIYTGKDIEKYFLQEPQHYINYDRTKYQQVAKEDFYRAPDKLVYKFVSKKLAFAYDNTGSLVLNSANLLIPDIKSHSAKTALAFLNSNLFQFIYSAIFNDIKILKSNLSVLPFPPLKPDLKTEIENLVNNYLDRKSENSRERIEKIIYKCFNLTDNEIELIERFLGYENK